MKRYINRTLKNTFFKNSLLYTVGSMVTPLIGFIMLPVYTRSFTTEEYGVLTTIQTLVGMLQFILLLSLQSAVTRFYYDHLNNPEKQREYLGTIYLFVLVFSSLIGLLLLIFSAPIGTLLFKNIPINPFYYYLLCLSWVTALLTLPMTLLRVKEKAGLYVLINLLKALFIMGTTIILVVFMDYGVESVLFSQIVITSVVMLVMFVMQSKSLRLSMNIKYLLQSLAFSIPLLPHVASSWIISSADRIILEKYVDISDIGIYSLAVQVSLVLSLFYNSVNRALVPRYTKLKKEGLHDDAGRLLKIFNYLVIIFGLISIPVAMVGLSYLIPSNYNGAISFLPLLLIAQIISGLYFIPAAKLFYVKKTKIVATSSVISASISVLVCLTTAPYIGVYSAIISSFLSEFVRLLIVYRYSKKININIKE